MTEPLERRNLLAASSFSGINEGFDNSSPVEPQDRVASAVSSAGTQATIGIVEQPTGRNDRPSGEALSGRNVSAASESQIEFITDGGSVAVSAFQTSIETSSSFTSIGPPNTTSVFFENVILNSNGGQVDVSLADEFTRNDLSSVTDVLRTSRRITANTMAVDVSHSAVTQLPESLPIGQQFTTSDIRKAVRNLDIQLGQFAGKEFSWTETGIQFSQYTENVGLISLENASSLPVFSGVIGTHVFIDLADGRGAVAVVPGMSIDGNNRQLRAGFRHVSTTGTAMGVDQHMSMCVHLGEITSEAGAAAAYVSPKAWRMTAGKNAASWYDDTAAHVNSWQEARPSIVTGDNLILPEANKPFSHTAPWRRATYRRAFGESPLSATKHQELETKSTAHRFLDVHLGYPIGRLTAVSCSNLLGDFYAAGGSTVVGDSWLSHAMAAISHSSSKAALSLSVLGVVAWVSWWPVEHQMRSERRTVIGSSKVLDETMRAVRLTY